MHTYESSRIRFKTDLRRQIEPTDQHRQTGKHETTDKGTTKCMAIVVKYFSEEMHMEVVPGC